MTHDHPLAERTRESNRRTAWTLVSIALAFFIGVIGAYSIGAGSHSLNLIGLGAFVFVALAIGRHLGRRR